MESKHDNYFLVNSYYLQKELPDLDPKEGSQSNSETCVSSQLSQESLFHSLLAPIGTVMAEPRIQEYVCRLRPRGHWGWSSAMAWVASEGKRLCVPA